MISNPGNKKAAVCERYRPIVRDRDPIVCCESPGEARLLCLEVGSGSVGRYCSSIDCPDINRCWDQTWISKMAAAGTETQICRRW
jgi:hypothetical protein